MAHDVRTRCPRCGEWIWAGDAHTCTPGPLYLVPGTSPTDLPADRAGTTYRFYVVDHTTLIRRAVLKHEPAADLTGVTA